MIILSLSNWSKYATRFYSGQSRLLITTDFLAGKLNASTITHLINYDLPKDRKDYFQQIPACNKADNFNLISFVIWYDTLVLADIRDRFNARVELSALYDADVFL